MEEYFRQNYFLILNEGVIILAGITGLIFLKKFKQTNVRFFIYFLVYVVFVELIGYYPLFSIKIDSLHWLYEWNQGTILEKNHLWYAIFWEIGSALFLSLYFLRIVENITYRAILKNALIVYCIAIILGFMVFYETYYTTQSKVIWFLGVVQIIICTVCYFLELLTSEKITTFYKSMNFYIAAVFFVWFLIMTPLVFYQIYYSRADWSFVFLKRDIILFANLLMYVTFIFSFIFCKPHYD